MEYGSEKLPVFTIGHSTHTPNDFIGLLKNHSIAIVVDIRTVPRSRHNPQYNTETLPENLRSEGIGYIHMPGLGGLRRPKKDSPNTAWRNLSFRGFADYMQTEEFEKNLAELVNIASSARIALMCAEAVPWRCHRSLVADALLVRGIRVEHIVGLKSSPHKITPFAKVEGVKIAYPSSEDK